MDGVNNAKKICSLPLPLLSIILAQVVFALLVFVLLLLRYLSLFLSLFLQNSIFLSAIKKSYQSTIISKLLLPTFWFCICTLKIKNGCENCWKKSSISLNVLLKVTEKKSSRPLVPKWKKKVPNAAFFSVCSSHFFEKKKKIKTKREWVQWSNNNYQAKMSNKDHQKNKTYCLC